MDKFDDFFKEKIEEETKEFPVPESFELKVEETLNNLPDNKKENWYINKKVIAVAACFAFVFLVGSRFINPINNNLRSRTSYTADTAEMALDESMNMPKAQGYALQDIQEIIPDVEEIESLNIKSLKEEQKYKFVDKREDIEQLISLINSLELTEIIDQGISEWDFIIQTNGGVNHSIMIKDNIINVDFKWYRCDENISDKLNELYNSFNYEEKYIAYCNF